MSTERLVCFGGLVHAWSPIGGSEHTLCGVAFDAADSENDEGLRFTSAEGNTKVTCGNCAAVINWCRGLTGSAA